MLQTAEGAMEEITASLQEDPGSGHSVSQQL